MNNFNKIFLFFMKWEIFHVIFNFWLFSAFYFLNINI